MRSPRWDYRRLFRWRSDELVSLLPATPRDRVGPGRVVGISVSEQTTGLVAVRGDPRWTIGLRRS